MSWGREYAKNTLVIVDGAVFKTGSNNLNGIYFKNVSFEGGLSTA